MFPSCGLRRRFHPHGGGNKLRGRPVPGIIKEGEKKTGLTVLNGAIQARRMAARRSTRKCSSPESSADFHREACRLEREMLDVIGNGAWTRIWKPGTDTVSEQNALHLFDHNDRAGQYVWFPSVLEKLHACFYRALYTALAMEGRDDELARVLSDASAALVRSETQAGVLVHRFVAGPALKALPSALTCAILIARICDGHWSALVPLHGGAGRAASVVYVDDAKQFVSEAQTDGVVLLRAMMRDASAYAVFPLGAAVAAHLTGTSSATPPDDPDRHVECTSSAPPPRARQCGVPRRAPSRRSGCSKCRYGANGCRKCVENFVPLKVQRLKVQLWAIGAAVQVKVKNSWVDGVVEGGAPPGKVRVVWDREKIVSDVANRPALVRARPRRGMRSTSKRARRDYLEVATRNS
jgi:hypothetical protein